MKYQKTNINKQIKGTLLHMSKYMLRLLLK